MIRFNCGSCGKALEVDDAYAGSSGACPFCGKSVAVPSAAGSTTMLVTTADLVTGPPPAGSPAEAAPPAAKTSGWAIASLVCGILGCLTLPAIPAIVFGILGIRQVNRSQGAIKGQGLAIAGLVLGCLFTLLLPAVLIPALSAARKTANQMKCGANLRNIGQAIKIYASQNKGHWPTVYAYNNTITGEAWGKAYADESDTLDDRVATAGTKLGAHPPFTCNISSWWILVRSGMASPAVFICPETTMDADTTQEPTQYWSFSKIGNMSYSYQNQLRTAGNTLGQYYGGNTNDNCDGNVIVAADRNPMRGDVKEVPAGSSEKDVSLWNSPNHDFEGQNCLYADGHVEFEKTPACGFGHNNIWTRSTYTPNPDGAANGTWTEDAASYHRTAGSPPSGNWNTGCGNKNDSFLVP
jgi:prepilin-type processing-associated H-X9-DG protein